MACDPLVWRDASECSSFDRGLLPDPADSRVDPTRSTCPTLLARAVTPNIFPGAQSVISQTSSFITTPFHKQEAARCEICTVHLSKLLTEAAVLHSEWLADTYGPDADDGPGENGTVGPISDETMAFIKSADDTSIELMGVRGTSVDWHRYHHYALSMQSALESLSRQTSKSDKKSNPALRQSLLGKYSALKRDEVTLTNYDAVRAMGSRVLSTAEHLGMAVDESAWHGDSCRSTGLAFAKGYKNILARSGQDRLTALIDLHRTLHAEHPDVTIAESVYCVMDPAEEGGDPVRTEVEPYAYPRSVIGNSGLPDVLIMAIGPEVVASTVIDLLR